MDEEKNYQRFGFCTFRTEDLYLMAALSYLNVSPKKVRCNTKKIISAIYEDSERNRKYVEEFYEGKMRLDPLALKKERVLLKSAAKSTENPYPYPK